MTTIEHDMVMGPRRIYRVYADEKPVVSLVDHTGEGWNPAYDHASRIFNELMNSGEYTSVKMTTQEPYGDPRVDSIWTAGANV